MILIKKYMKICFGWQVTSTSKSIEIRSLIIAVRAVFQENNKYYLQAFKTNVNINYRKYIKILYYDQIDVSEEIGITNPSASRECDFCHYWYFLNKKLKFKIYLYNRCNDLLMCLWDVAILLF